MSLLNYLLSEYPTVLSLLLEHIQLTILAVAIAIIIGVPLGITVYFTDRMEKVIMGSVNLVQAIPSMALLGAAIPLLGIGKLPAIVVVALYSLLPIVKNTATGIQNTPREILEAAKGIGLTDMQILLKVQIPIALPVIMTGIRISAVTAVGLITIAAFIGAGGLGFLVFSGISTVNNNLILAGAIPACLLALAVDHLGMLVEKRMYSARGRKHVQWKSSKRSIMKVAIAAVLLLCIGGVVQQRFFSGRDKKLVIGGKDYTEQHILPHLYAELIEGRSDVRVVRQTNLGGTKICFAALTSGDIDMYIEYSGTAYGDVLGLPPNSDMKEVYDIVKKEYKERFNIEVLEQTGFNNTYTVATTREIARRHGLKNISDLVEKAQQFSTAMSFEFLNRQDGLPGLSLHYGFEFGKANAMNAAQRYVALDNGDVQFIDAFSTDGLLRKFDLAVLKDDKHFFPPYYAMPIMRAEAAEQFKDIIPLIESLGKELTDEIMMELNYRVDELQQDPRTVALDFLRQRKMIP